MKIFKVFKPNIIIGLISTAIALFFMCSYLNSIREESNFYFIGLQFFFAFISMMMFSYWGDDEFNSLFK